MGIIQILIVVLVLESTNVLGINDTCYSYLGCFPMGSPWSTTLRPLPPPQAPDVIDTGFYLYTRNQPARYYVTKLPDISLAGSDYDGSRPTFLLTHGFAHDGNKTWLTDMKDAYLKRVDANFIIVDWGKGAEVINYLQVASNTRVVAAEVARLLKYLIATQGADVSRIHLAGHSLGSQIMSYVGKAIPNIARITAMDPAQPGFEGYEKEVRLDVSDALFVEVIHTNSAPFIPLLGVGMMGAYGHVDFYMNGGWTQPGCVLPPMPPNIKSLNDLAGVSVEELANYVACPHQRAFQYFTDSLANPNCSYWGRSNNLDIFSLFNSGCTATSCSPMGLDTINYQARGSFFVSTGFVGPYCVKDVNADTKMASFRTRNQAALF